jgi:drug/metabolite transporter (DMT)-like permease|tara:strand:- start:1125 stop:2006 length:882 start_codon:yes stop_codon:yes gene_type:complete
MNNRILFPFTALCLIWGSTWYFIKISLNAGVPPFYGVGLRFLFSGIIFFIYIYYKKLSIPTTPQAIKLYLSFGLLNFSLSYGMTYWATQYIYSSISSILWGLFPLFTSLMAHFMIKDDPDERLNKNKIFALMMGLVGVAIMSANQEIDFASQSFSAILVLISVIIIAAYPSVQYKKYNDEVGPYQMNAVCQVMTGIVMLSMSSLFNEDLSVIIWNNELILSTLYLIIFGGFISWGIYFWLYQHLNVTQVTYVAIFPPIVAIFLGWVFLGEVLSSQEIIGTLLILGSSILIYRK